ncbi:MAG: alpha/beta fold hydrolase [Mariprofundaceae bacterium]|nr:alpha/beta fold hydrolase [Mariprofundaceae bacterium]
MNPPLIFMHGWGQSKQIWHQQQSQFPTAKFLNLPGHGGEPDSIDWLTTLAKQLPENPCILVGWSLGGMLAMQLALAYPERIKALALVSSTPCFSQKEGWAHGCTDEVLQGFKQGIKHQAAKTMSRFFALMFHCEAMERRQFNSIARAAVDRDQPSSAQGMQEGLRLLTDLDLRTDISKITQPTWIAHGENDAIIPVQASEFLAKHISHSTLHRFSSCGHAPFLTQAETFHRLLESWCHTI